MWTPTGCALHSRAALRYGSDLTDAEWAIVAPLLPMPCDRGDVAADTVARYSTQFSMC